jgi:Flp pilus assembly protein TadD
VVECYERIVKLTQSPVTVKNQRFDFITASYQDAGNNSFQFNLTAVRGAHKIQAQAVGVCKSERDGGSHTEFKVSVPSNQWLSMAGGFLVGLFFLVAAWVISSWEGMLVTGGLALCFSYLLQTYDRYLNQRKLAYLLLDALGQPVKAPNIMRYALLTWIGLAMTVGWAITMVLSFMGLHLSAAKALQIDLVALIVFPAFFGYAFLNGIGAMYAVYRSAGHLHFKRALRLVRLFGLVSPHALLGNPLFTILRIQILLTSSRFAEAEAVTHAWLQKKRMRQIGADCSIPLMMLGASAFDQDDLDAAYHWLTQALQYNAKTAAACINLALVYLLRGEQTQTVLSLLKTAEDNLDRSWLGRYVLPQTTIPHLRALQAWAHVQLGDLDRARQLLAEAVLPIPSYEYRPGEAEVRYRAGMVYQLLGESEAARGQFEQAVAAHPDSCVSRKAQQCLNDLTT